MEVLTFYMWLTQFRGFCFSVLLLHVTILEYNFESCVVYAEFSFKSFIAPPKFSDLPTAIAALRNEIIRWTVPIFQACQILIFKVLAAFFLFATTTEQSISNMSNCASNQIKDKISAFLCPKLSKMDHNEGNLCVWVLGLLSYLSYCSW